MVTSWLDRRERELLAYLIEENRLLRRQVGGRACGLPMTTYDFAVPGVVGGSPSASPDARRPSSAHHPRGGTRMLCRSQSFPGPRTRQAELFGNGVKGRRPRTVVELLAGEDN